MQRDDFTLQRCNTTNNSILKNKYHIYKKIKNHFEVIQLKGNIGRKPIIKRMANGSKLARSTLAENIYFYTMEGQRMQETQWQSIIG